MSKAFTKEDGADDTSVSRPRPVGGGERRPITAEGFQRLQAELDTIEVQRRALKASPPLASAAALAELTDRSGQLLAILAQVAPQPPLTAPPERVVFGAWVTVEDEEGHRSRYRIVGPDEADAREAWLSFHAPLARALLGRTVGEAVLVERPRGEVELTVVALSG